MKFLINLVVGGCGLSFIIFFVSLSIKEVLLIKRENQSQFSGDMKIRKDYRNHMKSKMVVILIHLVQKIIRLTMEFH